MNRQSTNTVVMVRPDHFGFNPQTAETNPFMHDPESLHETARDVRVRAQKEFDGMVTLLREHGVEVILLPTREDAMTPDAVFPNNWFSHHQNGTLVLYPMLTPNRRLERQQNLLVSLLQQRSIAVDDVIDLTSNEETDTILESTGSMVFDRVSKVAFAMASPRTNEVLFRKWCKTMGYESVYIVTPKSHFKEVYHTNLLMSIGTSFAVVCLDVIEDGAVKLQMKDLLRDLGKEVIEISLNQVYAFCGNILEVQSTTGDKKIVTSATAKEAFTTKQLEQLSKHGEIVAVSIPTIEKVGGGGARCMMAEVFTN